MAQRLYLRAIKEVSQRPFFGDNYKNDFDHRSVFIMVLVGKKSVISDCCVASFSSEEQST